MDDVFDELTVSDEVAAGVVRADHAERLCAGHFPGDPLVPGASLARLMAALASRLVGGGEPRALVRCAFHARVTPAQRILVSARRTADAEVDAEVRVAGRRAARATFRFGAPT